MCEKSRFPVGPDRDLRLRPETCGLLLKAPPEAFTDAQDTQPCTRTQAQQPGKERRKGAGRGSGGGVEVQPYLTTKTSAGPIGGPGLPWPSCPSIGITRLHSDLFALPVHILFRLLHLHGTPRSRTAVQRRPTCRSPLLGLSSRPSLSGYQEIRLQVPALTTLSNVRSLYHHMRHPCGLCRLRTLLDLNNVGANCCRCGDTLWMWHLRTADGHISGTRASGSS